GETSTSDAIHASKRAADKYAAIRLQWQGQDTGARRRGSKDKIKVGGDFSIFIKARQASSNIPVHSREEAAEQNRMVWKLQQRIHGAYNTGIGFEARVQRTSREQSSDPIGASKTGHRHVNQPVGRIHGEHVGVGRSRCDVGNVAITVRWKTDEIGRGVCLDDDSPVRLDGKLRQGGGEV